MALLYIECIKLSHYFMLKNILVSLCHCSRGCLHMLVCASKLMRWQIVNVCASILSVNIIYPMVAGMRRNVRFMYIYPFHIPLISFSCQNIFKFSFCQIQCGSWKIIKSTFVLLHGQRGDVWLHHRDPLSGLRFAPLLLGIQGERRCCGSLPDNVILKVGERDSRNTRVSERYLVFSIGKELYSRRASPPTFTYNHSRVPVFLVQSEGSPELWGCWHSQMAIVSLIGHWQ